MERIKAGMPAGSIGTFVVKRIITLITTKNKIVTPKDL
jgi:hypothetical protein